MPPLTIVFDFDGTLADTMEAYARAWNQVAGEFGLKRITPEEVQALRHKKPKEIMNYLGLTPLKLPAAARRVRRELNKNIDRLPCFPGIKETLSELKDRGHHLGIVTSNNRENVAKFLEARGLELFDFIYTGSKIFGKAAVLRSALKKHGLRPGEAVYICDEVRDIEAARKSKLRVVAVSWGFNSRQALEKESPDALAEEPGDLAGILEGMSG